MARSIAQIQKQIWTGVTTNVTLMSMLTSTSQVAVWYLMTWVVATAQQVEESLWDANQADVLDIIAAQKAHTPQWYATMAKAFQYGDSLPADSDTYAVVRAAGDPAFVVTYAAVVELANLLRIKVATGAVGSLAALSSGQLSALTAYMGRVKDAGVRLQITSGAADNLQLSVIVYYDPLILNVQGQRIDGTENTPVLDASNAFLNGLPFNGVYGLNNHIAALRAVSGVKDVDVVVCQANYAATPYVNIMTAAPQQYTPDAGYLALDAGYFNANVSYVAMP